MEIIVSGKAKKQLVSETVRVIDWVLKNPKFSVINQRVDTLIIRFGNFGRYRKAFPSGDENDLGYTDILFGTPGTQTVFEVCLNTDTPMDALLRTTIHELVHVKQSVAGEFGIIMDDDETQWYVWKGKRICPDSMSYWDYPWEVEAYTLEERLSRYHGLLAA